MSEDIRTTDVWPPAPGRISLVGQRKPKWVIAAIDAENDAWDEYSKLVNIHEMAGTETTRLNMEYAKARWTAAFAARAAAVGLYHRDPAAAWDAEDAADTREAGSAGYQGGE